LEINLQYFYLLLSKISLKMTNETYTFDINNSKSNHPNQNKKPFLGFYFEILKEAIPKSHQIGLSK